MKFTEIMKVSLFHRNLRPKFFFKPNKNGTFTVILAILKYFPFLQMYSNIYLYVVSDSGRYCVNIKMFEKKSRLGLSFS